MPTDADLLRLLFLGATLLTILIVPSSKQISPARLGEFLALLFALVLGLYLMSSATTSSPSISPSRWSR